MKPRELPEKLRQVLRAEVTDDGKRRRLKFIGVFCLLTVLASGMTVLNALTGRGVLTWVTLLFSVLCLADLLLTLWRGERGLRLASGLLSVEITVLFIYFIITGGPEGFSVLWLCMLPTCGVLLFGIKPAAGMCAVMEALLIFFFHTETGRGLLRYSYSPTFRARFPLLFLALFLISCLLAVIQLVTQRELSQLRNQYEYLSLHDALTKLLNRTGLREWERQVTEKGDQTVLMIDIDHFKRVNDSYGHSVGDLALARTAAAIEELFRTRVCRWGGEEFVVWSPDGSLTRQDAEELRRAVERMVLQVPNCDKTFRITISIGGARGTPLSALDDLIHRADERLYQAKAEGRNRVVFPDDES